MNQEEIDQRIISLDNFRVIANIGHGSFVSVCLIENINTSQQYVAKVYNYFESEFLQHIVSILFKLQHPTLNKTIGYSVKSPTGENQFTLINEYCTNGSLEQVLTSKSKKITNTYKQIILVGTCRALSILHQNRFVHRDIKPSKILLDENFYPHLILSETIVSIDDNDAIIKMAGTPLYLAPEIITGDFPYDSKVDIYSFSLVLYQIITEKQIFPKVKTRPNLYKNVKVGVRPEFPDSIKDSLRNLIEKCWSGDPDERPTSDELFQKLAFDKEFYLDDVDSDKLNSYINLIK